MGLIHATSLERWREWQRLHRPAKALAPGRRASRSPCGSGPLLELHSRDGEGDARILILVDPVTRETRQQLLALLPYLHAPVDVLAPAGAELPETAGPQWQAREAEAPGQALHDRGIRAVVSSGQHSESGVLAHRWAQRVGVEAYVVQTGLLTPYAPPLPPDSTVLAWSPEDGEFWRSEREDVVVRSIGSQRLWQARHEAPLEHVVSDGPPVFLGHLADPTLSRRLSARAAFTFCREHGGVYRPGAEDTDPRSRLTHALWKRRGIRFVPAADQPVQPEDGEGAEEGTAAEDPPRGAADAQHVPVADDEADAAPPVVAVRDLEVLEAAARGVPAWTFAPGAPEWLREYWERYGMRGYGGAHPTPAPRLPEAEPAAALAEILESVV